MIFYSQMEFLLVPSNSQDAPKQNMNFFSAPMLQISW